MQSNTEACLLALDIFGQGIQFTLNGQLTSKTKFGGTLSIIMIALLLAMFFVTAGDVLNHINPQISVESAILNEGPEIILDNSNFPIAIAVTGNSNGAIVDLKKFNYKFLLIQGDTEIGPTPIEINMTKCNKEFFPNINQEKYDSLGMGEYFCVKNQKFLLKGSWAESNISYVSLRLTMCVNTTAAGEPCDSQKEINNYITESSLFFNIYFQDTIINAQNSKSPIIYTISNHYKSIKANSNKILDYFVRNQTLVSDDGFMFRESNIFQTLAFDYYTYDENYMDQNNVLVQFDFYGSQNKFTYHRRYQKIQEVLASVGGLANILKISFILICYIFSVVKRDEILLNKIFDFHFNEDENETPAKTIINILNIEKLNEIKVTNTKLSSNELKDIDYKDKSHDRLRKDESNINPNSTVKNDYKNFDIDASPSKLSNYYEREDINKSQLSLELYPLSECLEKIPRKESLNFKCKFSIKNGLPIIPVMDESKSENSNSEDPINRDNIPEIEKFKDCGKEILKPEDKSVSEEIIKSETYKVEDELANQKIQSCIHESKNPPIGELNNKELSSTIKENNINNIEPKLSLDSTKKKKFLIKKTLVEMHDERLFNIDIKNKQDDQLAKFKDTKDFLNFLDQKDKNNRLNFSFYEVIRGFVCCRCCRNKKINIKIKLYERSKKTVLNFLDVAFIIQQFEELERLKIIVLNTEQLALFNFVSKEVISLDDDKRKLHHLTRLKSFVKNKEDLANVIINFKNRIASSVDIDKADRKIYNLLNEELK